MTLYNDINMTQIYLVVLALCVATVTRGTIRSHVQQQPAVLNIFTQTVKSSTSKYLSDVFAEQCGPLQDEYGHRQISCRRTRQHLEVTCDWPAGRQDADPCDETTQQQQQQQQ